MNVIKSVKEMQAFSEASRSQGQKIAFVPTMGYLHHGHARLMQEGRKLGDVLIVSIFVNPTQFGAGEDFEKYPRDWDRDAQLCASAGVDVIFAPTAEEIYPHGYQTSITVSQVTQNLCGVSRPTHFQGVAMVVAKLFNCTKPHVALFGEKDFQQLVVIQRMVKDLNMDIQIIGVPTVREQDGLAMSSRNTYLSADERMSALSLSRGLSRARELFQQGERSALVLIATVRQIIEKEKCAAVEYVQVCDIETLQDIDVISQPAVMALAVKIGKARLIDNIVLKE
ncbi:MAG: pantoate--beta-alanine ligase [Proteobacteria bacterium]|nr:pantoate--beta-alanine ligase [Pseudomonadota bacterium]